jgi:hypothetical protein
MPDDLVAGYRKNADLCRQTAERATDEIKKANWTKFAEEWLKLADAAEGSKTPARSCDAPVDRCQALAVVLHGVTASGKTS